LKTHTKGEKVGMKNDIWSKLGGAALLGLMILGFALPTGQSATTVTLTASVEGQECQGYAAIVSLTATLNPPAQNVQFQWDFDNDGIFDTPLSPDPRVQHLYAGGGQRETAAVKAVKGGRSATASVTFRTVRC
jgi:hypothetical protein